MGANLLRALALVMSLCMGCEAATKGNDGTAGTLDGDSVLNDAVDDVVTWLNEGTLERREYKQHFAAEFRSALGYDDLIAALEMFTPSGPWSLDRSMVVDGNVVVALLRGEQGGDLVQVQLRITTAPPFQISELLLQPVSPNSTSFDPSQGGTKF